MGLILFYDCDCLHWISSSVYFALISGDCVRSSECGSLTLALFIVDGTADWYLGAFKEYFMIVIIFIGLILMLNLLSLVVIAMMAHIVVR